MGDLPLRNGVASVHCPYQGSGPRLPGAPGVRATGVGGRTLPGPEPVRQPPSGGPNVRNRGGCGLHGSHVLCHGWRQRVQHGDSERSNRHRATPCSCGDSSPSR